MKKVTILLMGILITFVSIAQNKVATWKYATMDFVKTTPEGKYDEFLKEKWSVLAQKRLNVGTILGWDVWGVGHTTNESKYDLVIITLYSSLDSLWKGSGIKRIGNYTDLDEEAIMEKVDQSRKIIATALIANKYGWSTIDTTAKFANFNYLKINAGSNDEYEKSVPKVNTAASKINKALSFSLSKRIDLTGEDVSWNYGGAYFYNTYADMMEARAETLPLTPEQVKITSLRKVSRSEVLYNKYSLRKKTN
ncbi:MAG: hypothetical protein EBT39_04550 [Sphingobacteriia bacterium]|nr:hypothetical protein [Candidatus Fonsibacter lacus]